MGKKILILLITFLMGVANAQVKYQVSGNVYLEDQLPSGSHEGVAIKFFNLPDMTLEDSTLSQSDGSYLINISPGYYLVKWVKDGYVPEELGGLALAADTVLNDVTLIPGEVMEVSGNVSGTWTTSYVYYVTGDIQVLAGNTLTINAGVKVKFADSTNFDVYGTLNVMGEEDNHVVFTSLNPSPTPGDWGRVKLYAPNNIIKWLDYEWATDGIHGDGASNSLFEGLTINGNLKHGANGLYLENSSNVSIKKSKINVTGDYGIYITSPQAAVIEDDSVWSSNFSVYAYNLQNASIKRSYFDKGLYILNSSGTTIDSINVQSIDAHGATQFEVQNSEFRGSLHIDGGSNLTVKQNNFVSGGVTGWEYNGHYVSNALFENNRIFSNNNGIDCGYGTEIIIRNNYINSYNNGVQLKSGTIENDTIITRGTHYYNIWGKDNGEMVINNNYVSGVRTIRLYSKKTLLSNNTFLLRGGRAIYCSGDSLIVLNNKFKSEWSYYSGSLLYSTATTIFKNNEVDSLNSGLSLSNSSNSIIDSNKFDLGSDIFYFVNSSVAVRNNVVKLNYLSSYPINFDNNSQITFRNNTVYSNSHSGYAIYSTGNSVVDLTNNTFSGFQQGIYVDNSVVNYNIKYNNLWDISSNLFSGSAMPPLIGQFIAENANGDAADIYNNISFDPEFVNPDSADFNLAATSHLINAGDPTYKDPDSTVSDIGALYHHIYVVIEHTPLSSTSDTVNAYTVSANIISPSGLPITANLYYSINNGGFNEVAMTSSKGTFTADILAQPLNTYIKYFIEATDGEHIVTSPADTSRQMYSFHVTLFSSFSNLSANSLTDGTIKLTWNRPTPTEGTFLGFKLYKSEQEGFEVADSLLFSSFPADSFSVIDANVREGHYYYYKLGGLLELNGDTVESVVSEETAGLSDNATIVRVTGRVVLEGTADYSGVRVLFEKVSPSAIQDTLFTGSDGVIDKIMHVGIYNIHISKDGYKPILLGNRFLSDNMSLDTIYMNIGGAVSLSGAVSGRLVSSNVYFVDDSIYVPAGDTLRIEPGTEIKFRGNYGFAIYGRVNFIGTADSMITFTSGMPAPNEGDWGRIYFDGSQNSKIKYCNFYYASNGFVIDNGDGMEISHCVFDHFKLGSTAISNNSSFNGSITVKHNSFINKFDDGIVLKNISNSIIDSNYFNGKGIILYNSTGSFRVGGNKGLGNINIYSSTNLNKVLINNQRCGTINIAKTDSIIINDIHTSSVYVDNNGYFLIRDSYCNSIDISRKRNDVLTIIKRDSVIGKRGIKIDGLSSDRILTFIDSNYFSVEDGQSYSRSAIDGNFLKITNNKIVSSVESDWNTHNLFRNIDNSVIINNEINLSGFAGCCGYVILKTLFSGNSNIIFEKNNVKGNIIDGRGGGSLGAVSNSLFKNNVLENLRSSGNLENIIFNKNRLKNCEITIGGNSEVKKNTFVTGNSISVLTLSGTNANVFKNTFIQNEAYHGKAIYIMNNSMPDINSNLIYGYDKGIEASSSSNIYSLKFNLIYNCNTPLTGSGIPDQAGEVVTVNNNGDPSDIYSNIFLDPKLKYDSTRGGYTYELLANSPAINAGDIDSTDIDGTIVEIGAYFFNFGYVPDPVRQDSTGDGFIAFSWDIIETDSLQGYEPYYKLNADENWTALPQTPEKHVVITGLTNNSVYRFKVRAVYPTRKSNFSNIVTARPGTATMTVSPKYLIAFMNEGETVTKEFYVTNSGNRDLTFSVPNYDEHYLNYNSSIVPPDSSFPVTDTLKGEEYGVYISKIIVNSDDSESKTDTVNVLKSVGMADPLSPQHFTPVAATDKKFYFVVSSAIMDGENLQTGDEIGLFAGDLCVGAAGFNGVYPLIITAYGSAKGGFNENDTITVKLYDYGTNAEGRAVTSYVVGDGLFHDGQFAQVSITGSIYEILQIPIEPNRFNLISTYLMPKNMNAENVFNSIAGLQIAYEDNGSAYIPAYGINTIGSYDMTEGYHVFTTDSNAVLNIYGKRINAQNYTLTIEASKFNSIPYLYDAEMADTVAFASIADNISIVQDDEGGVWIPSLGVNSLGNLVPMKGYQIYLNTTQDVRFVYPALTKNGAFPKNNADEEIVEPTHFKFEKTGSPYAIVINSASFDGVSLSNGDEVGIFDGELCVGATVWDTSKVNYVIAWEGNEDYNVKGYKAGDNISVRLYLKKYDQEIKATPKFAKDTEGKFEGAAYSKMDIHSEPGIIPRKFELSQNYPNPFNPTTTISYALPKKANVKLVIYNILGEQVKTLVNNQTQNAGRYKVVWKADNDMGYKVSSGVYFIRLIADKFVSVKKAVLLK